MPAGLQIFNPSNTIVISSDAQGYKFFGYATLYASGYKEVFSGGTYNAGNLFPYVYRVTLPNSTMVPIVGLSLTTTEIKFVDSMQNLGSGIWEIRVFCISRAYTLDIATTTLVSPGNIYVFCPVSAADVTSSGAGLQLYNSSGVLSYTSDATPLWFREKVDCSATSDTGAPYNPLAENGASTTWSNTANTVVLLAGVAGDYQRVNDTSGEDILLGYFGWTYTGTSLKREFIMYRHEFRETDGGGSTISIGSNLYATSILCADSTIY